MATRRQKRRLADMSQLVDLTTEGDDSPETQSKTTINPPDNTKPADAGNGNKNKGNQSKKSQQAPPAPKLSFAEQAKLNLISGKQWRDMHKKLVDDFSATKSDDAETAGNAGAQLRSYKAFMQQHGAQYFPDHWAIALRCLADLERGLFESDPEAYKAEYGSL